MDGVGSPYHSRTTQSFGRPLMSSEGTLNSVEVIGFGASPERHEDQILRRLRGDYDRRKDFRKRPLIHLHDNLDIRQVKLDVVYAIHSSLPRRQYHIAVWVISLVKTKKLVMILCFDGAAKYERFYCVLMVRP